MGSKRIWFCITASGHGTKLNFNFKINLANLLGMTLEHQVLLALVQSAFLQSPEMEYSVFPLKQLTEDTYRYARMHTHGSEKNKHYETHVKHLLMEFLRVLYWLHCTSV